MWFVHDHQLGQFYLAQSASLEIWVMLVNDMHLPIDILWGSKMLFKAELNPISSSSSYSLRSNSCFLWTWWITHQIKGCWHTHTSILSIYQHTALGNQEECEGYIIAIDSGSNIVVMIPDMDPSAREYILLAGITQTGRDAIEDKNIIFCFRSSNSSLLLEDNKVHLSPCQG